LRKIDPVTAFATFRRVITAKKRPKTAGTSRYRRYSGNFARRLSYQGGDIAGIVRMSDMPVCGDRQFVIDF
jgi:hypothetical protein